MSVSILMEHNEPWSIWVQTPISTILTVGWSCVGFGMTSNRNRCWQTLTKENFEEGLSGTPRICRNFENLKGWKQGKLLRKPETQQFCQRKPSRDTPLSRWHGTPSSLIVHILKREPLIVFQVSDLPPRTRYWWALPQPQQTIPRGKWYFYVVRKGGKILRNEELISLH